METGGLTNSQSALLFESMDKVMKSHRKRQGKSASLKFWSTEQMEDVQVLGLALILCMITTQTSAQYYSQSVPYESLPEKTTNLHFFFHVTLSGKKPHVVLVSRPNTTKDGKSEAPFGIIFAIDDPLTDGPLYKAMVGYHIAACVCVSSMESSFVAHKR